MPKIKVRVTSFDYQNPQDTLSATYIVEAPSPISAMAKFSAAAKTMPYTGPVTDEPAEDPDAKKS